MLTKQEISFQAVFKKSFFTQFFRFTGKFLANGEASMVHGGIYLFGLVFGKKVLFLFFHGNQASHQGGIEHLKLDLFDICYGFV